MAGDEMACVAQIQSPGILDAISDTLGVSDLPGVAPKLIPSFIDLGMDVNNGGFLASAVVLESALALDINAIAIYDFLDATKVQRLQFLTLWSSDSVNVGAQVLALETTTSLGHVIDNIIAPITTGYQTVPLVQQMIFGVGQQLRIIFTGAGAGDTGQVEYGYIQTEHYCQVAL